MGETLFNHTKGFGSLLAIAIASLTTAALLFIPVPKIALIVTFLISFASSYILFNIIFEFLVFKEVSKIHAVLRKIKKKDLTVIKYPKKTFLNPLKELNQELYSYATLKQREIDNLKKMATFRREFLADVSHELKTPIFAAQGYVHTLLDGAMEDEDVRDKFLEKAAKSLDGLDLLVQDLLTLSQIETGDITMHTTDFNIYAHTKEIIDQAEAKAEKRNIQLQFAAGCKRNVFVHADAQRIDQVMTNLISNAIKYGKDNGTVTVDFKKKKDEVVVFVSDDGQGIAPDHLPRIFERFYRVEKSRSKDKGGTGLGLAIVKHILEGHKSNITVASKIGEGTTFSFKLTKGRSLKKKEEA